MNRLTAREEEIMNFFWEKGPLYVKEILAFYDGVKPHINTISTFVRGLEDKGLLAHEVCGNSYRYFATVSRKEFSERTLKGVINKYFNHSYIDAVSALLRKEDLSVEDLKQLIQNVEKN